MLADQNGMAQVATASAGILPAAWVSNLANPRNSSKAALRSKELYWRALANSEDTRSGWVKTTARSTPARSPDTAWTTWS